MKRRIFSLLVICALVLATQAAYADSATWTGSSISGGGSWTDDRNWNPETVPNGPDDIATFTVSDQMTVNLQYDYGIELDSFVFDQDASSYAFTVNEGDVLFTGTGITNNSGKLQTLDCGRICYNCHGGFSNSFNFFNNATAGDLTALTIEGPDEDEIFGGELWFYNSSTAGSALITNAGGSTDSYPATTFFVDESSAENATIINEGSIAPYAAGHLNFSDNATADHATIINNGALSKDGQGGKVTLRGLNSGDSTIICNGDTVGSNYPATVLLSGAGGRVRVILFGNGQLQVGSGVYRSKGTVGSIEGDGNIFLGEFAIAELTVGTNNLSTTFAGIIQDSSFASGGELQKIGTGILTLTGANTYAGGTTVRAGQLEVNNSAGSGTGTGPVLVNAGTISGRGTIAGSVTVGNGAGPSAFLAPGGDRIATLTIQAEIIFNPDSNYTYAINARNARADETIANGVTINPGATFSLSVVGNRRLEPGTVFTAINNTSVAAISGSFTNLPDGGTITVGRNTFQANYEGGDGNDLTLTVVP